MGFRYAPATMAAHKPPSANMPARDNKSYYDEFSSWYERHRHRGYHTFIDQLEADAVLRHATPDSRVLEAGCGTGLILRRLAERVRLAVGLDLSAGMLRRAHERKLPVVQASVTNVPFADESFDLVCSFKVLAHVEPIHDALAELGRVLRPGGRLVAEFYNTRSLRYLIKRVKRPSAISQQTNDEAVYTRYDNLERIRGYLPAGLTIESVRGVRVLTPVSHVHDIPVVGAALRRAETHAADHRVLGSFGGFLVVTAKKAGAA